MTAPGGESLPGPSRPHRGGGGLRGHPVPRMKYGGTQCGPEVCGVGQSRAYSPCSWSLRCERSNRSRCQASAGRSAGVSRCDSVARTHADKQTSDRIDNGLADRTERHDPRVSDQQPALAGAWRRAAAAAPRSGEHIPAPEIAEEEGYSFRGLYFTGDYLLLQPRRNAMDYAIVSPNITQTPAGTVESVNWNTESGFRFGTGFRLPGQDWSIGVNYRTSPATPTIR